MKFTSTDGGEIKFKLVFDNDEGVLSPHKLGDGNFGVVYAAISDEKTEKLAMKVIYKHQSIDSPKENQVETKKIRILDELMVKKNIAEELDLRSNDPNIPENIREKFATALTGYTEFLVLPKAYSDNIFSKNTYTGDEAEFKKFCEAASRNNIEFSEYAYIMDRFECSLKDLVEQGIQVTRDPLTRSTGYRVLSAAPIVEREKSALYVLRSVANGLKVLHLAGYRHQDIKPANIYYKPSADKRVVFKLGDLGFLRPQNPVLAGSAMVSSGELAIGTKHYRSVEQIDFSDTSEVVVEMDDNNKIALLVSYDPKFSHTNIDVGDLVFFPKTGSQKLIQIISKGKSKRNEVPVTLLGISRPDANVVVDREKTQAGFVKNPTARTDLFGLGAILFDIITAGDSPERLYELLRPFDRADRRINDSILSYYSVWQAGQFVDPEVSAIFQRIGGGSAFRGASEPIVEFLLRCCMSEPDDSFYNVFGFRARNTDEEERFLDQVQWDGVIAEIDKLIEELAAQGHDKVAVNCLTRGNTSDRNAENGTEEAGEREATSKDKIRGNNFATSDQRRRPNTLLEFLPQHRARAAIFADLSDKVASSVGDDLWLTRALMVMKMIGGRSFQVYKQTSGALNGDRFVSLAPEHLVFSPVYTDLVHNEDFGIMDRDGFDQKLRKLDPVLCSLSPSLSKYLPIWWASRSRRVDVHTVKLSGAESFDIEYADFSPNWTGISPHDYLIVRGGSSSNRLLSISKINGQRLLCEVIPDKGRLSEIGSGVSPSDPRDDDLQHGYLVKRIVPLQYMASMLGIYVFHLFFHGFNGSGVQDFGPSVSSTISKIPLKNLRRPSAYTDLNSESVFSKFVSRFSKPETTTRSQRLVAHTQRLCLWLLLGEHNGDQGENEALRELESEFNGWFRLFAEEIGDKADGLAGLSIEKLETTKGSTVADADKCSNICSTLGNWRENWDQIAKDYLGVGDA